MNEKEMTFTQVFVLRDYLCIAWEFQDDGYDGLNLSFFPNEIT